MKAFLHTSVLVATFYGEHEHHEPSFALFLSLNDKTGCTAAHSLAEVYAVLTGMPGKNRVSPHEAMLFLSDVRQRLRIVSLTGPDHDAVLSHAASSGITGGGIYDAVIAWTGRKAKAEVIYTWNTKHFTRLGPEFASVVRNP